MLLLSQLQVQAERLVVETIIQTHHECNYRRALADTDLLTLK